MKKIAIFVEGMTEQELVVWLVTSIVGAAGLHFALGRQFAGKVQIEVTTVDPQTAFYVLVVDCACDEQVKSQIREQYPTLVAGGFSAIIGLRDVFPKTGPEIQGIIDNLMVGVPTDPILPNIHLALMEIEAWFLAELT